MKKSNISITKEIVNAKKVGTRAKLAQLIQRRIYVYSTSISPDWITTTGVTFARGDSTVKSMLSVDGTSNITGSATSGTYYNNALSTTYATASNSVFTSSNANMIKTSNMVLTADALDGISSIDFVGTNEQVKNVHEGDLVKTDGRRIFYVPSNSKKLHVIIIKDKKAFLERTVVLEGNITDMYITDSKVILIGSKGGYEDENLVKTIATSSYLYNEYNEQGFVQIRDKETMAPVYKLETESPLASHRLIKDSLFITTRKEAIDDAAFLDRCSRYNGSSTRNSHLFFYKQSITRNDFRDTQYV